MPASRFARTFTLPTSGAIASVARSLWPSSRFWSAGAALLVLGLLVLSLSRYALGADPRILAALYGGLVAALATALGTLPVLLSQRISQRFNDAMLGFGAGVMLAATSFSLVLPALSAAQAQGHGPWPAGGIVGMGIVLGAACLFLADRFVPHSRPGHGRSAAGAAAHRRAWIFIAAILLHNAPEGLAIGVAFAGTDMLQAQALTLGISIQDIPEGLVVALAFRGIGGGRAQAVALGIASGLIEPVAAVLGAAAISLSVGLLPVGLAFAGGAMLYAVSHEAIPGAHQQGNARLATGGLVLGFVLMMLLDTALAIPA